MKHISPPTNRRQLLQAGALISIGSIIDTAHPVEATASLSTQLTALAESTQAIVGGVIIGPDNNVVWKRNTISPFVSASLYKLVLLADILRRIDAGELGLDTTINLDPGFFGEDSWNDAYFAASLVNTPIKVEELMYASGAYSSNVASLALLTLTTFDQLNDLAIQLGMTGTRYHATWSEIADLYPGEDGHKGAEDLARSIVFSQSYSGADSVNLTTPQDMAWYFRLLQDDNLISELASWRLSKFSGPK